MNLMDKLREAIKNGKCPPIFKSSDLKNIGIDDPNNNLSNYDKKNEGTNNEKALVSRKIGQETYYTFDERIFPKNALKTKKSEDGAIHYFEPE